MKPLFRGSDRVLDLVTVALALFGIVMVYSASSYQGAVHYGDSFVFAKKQAIGVGLGCLALLCTRLVDYHKVVRARWLWLAVSLILLILVFVPGIGVENYGARRWIQLPGFTLQSSEFAKFAFVIFAAGYLNRFARDTVRFRTLLPVLGVALVICVLIMLQPNMSITMCMVLVTVALLWIGGARIKHLALLAVPIVIAVPVLILAEPYRLQRLLAFLDPWASPKGEGFQLLQSFYSLGSGGWFGLGLFQSRQKYLFLPFSESDFIFSIIGEELGLTGALCVMAVYVLLVFRCVRIALRAQDRLGCYLAGGIAAVIAVQVVVNLAVVTGSIPPTGLPLPLISAGSSSIVVTMAAIGLVQSVAIRSHALPLAHVRTRGRS